MINIRFNQQSRLVWIDYMKVIGMYLIILGHFFSYGYEYIYTFNVPLFFVISGFLCHPHNNDKRTYLKKTFFNLCVPMIIIFGILSCKEALHRIMNDDFSIIQYFFFCLYGACGFYKSLGILWFIYTLIVLKVIFIFTYNNKLVQGLLLITLPTISICLHYNYSTLENICRLEEYANGITNTCTAYPFFVLGNTMSYFKTNINHFNNRLYESIIAIVAILCISFCGSRNSIVMMYVNSYGDNYVLFLLGGTAGTILIYIISKWLKRFDASIIRTLSKGSILILGFHMTFKSYSRVLFPTPSWLDPILAFVILLIFIPIILLAEQYFPIILGKYRK